MAIFITFVIAVVAILVAKTALDRAHSAQEEVESLRAALDVLARRVHHPHAPADEPKPEPVVEVPKPAPPPPPPPPAPVVQPVAAFRAEPPAPPPPPPPAPRPAAPPPPPPPPPAAPKPPFDWESLIGVKLFSWIAGIALVLAALFFLRYSVEHGWLKPWVRATIGLVTGSVLIGVCELKVARGYKYTANAMHGAGIAILYATLFATYALWHLTSATVVFGGMILVTAVAVALSIVRDSMFIALLGLIGGFATPAMLSTGENRPFGLFGYLLLLNVGLAWVAMKKRWPVLTVISIAFTIVYQWAWVAKFLTPSQFPLAAGIFVVFALASAVSLFVRRAGDGKQRRFDYAAIAGATLPLAFAVFGAVVPAYGAHYNLLFGFLFVIAAGLSLIGSLRGPGWLHLTAGIATLLVFVFWSSLSYKHEAWPAALAWLAAFVVAQLVAAHFTELPSYTVAPVLFPMFAIFIAIEPATAAPLLVFAVLFALLAVIGAYAIVHDAGIVYFVAAFFTIAAEAVWSAKYLTPERLHGALAIYGIFAVFFLGVPIIARRFGRDLSPRNAVAVLLIASIAMLFFLAAGPVAPSALWGLALLLAVVNIGAMFESHSSAHPILSGAGIILSWIVIAVWCFNSMSAVNLIPALAVVGGFGVLAVLCNLWAGRGSAAPNDFARTIFLGLVGHVFLMFVAAQKGLAFPPWPLFAVMFVLNLAVGVAAIYVRRDKLMVGAMAASQLVLMIWTANIAVDSWRLVALGATIAVAAMALIWFAINRAFAAAAIAALFLGDVVAMIAGNRHITWPLLGAHVALLAAILALAWITEQHALATAAVPLLTFAVGLSDVQVPRDQFVFALAIFAPFVAYPLLLGARAKTSIHPYLAAVLMSAPFFVFTRDIMKTAGLQSMIGVLPVGEAIVMLILVVRLLRIPRELTRLALVAAAALAYITVAIPLQLEKQWITIGWALEGAALVWLFTRIPHKGLLAWSGALLTAVFVRLVFNPAVFEYHPQQHQAIINWYLYTYLVAAASFFVAAWLWRTPVGRLEPAAPLNAAGTILLFFLLNIEIADYYSHGPVLTFNFFSSSLAQDLTYTIGWAVFAVAMLIAGIAVRSRATRIAAILLLLITVVKGFVHDVGRLGGLYRIGSLLGLAVSAVLFTVLVQRFVMAKNTTTAETP
jgi:uncharacterized membrane protein